MLAKRCTRSICAPRKRQKLRRSVGDEDDDEPHDEQGRRHHHVEGEIHVHEDRRRCLEQPVDVHDELRAGGRADEQQDQEDGGDAARLDRGRERDEEQQQRERDAEPRARVDEQRLAAADGEGLALRVGEQRAEEPVHPHDPPVEDGRVGIDADLGELGFCPRSRLRQRFNARGRHGASPQPK
ncbi:MAG: hypothetical protein ACXWJ2_03285 [Hyphomicrobium sp.]